MKRITTVLGVFILLFAVSSGVFAQNERENTNYVQKADVENESYAEGANNYYKLLRGNPEYKDIINAYNMANKTPKTRNSSWAEVGPDNMAGRCRAFLIDRRNTSTLYASGTSGGLWISETEGSSWKFLTPNAENFAISCIAQDIDGNIYYGTGDGFSDITSEANGGSAFVGGGIYKSTDGKNFTLLNSTKPANISSPWSFIYKLAASPVSSRIYACTQQGLKFSDDGGQTWSSTILLPGTNPYEKEANDIEIGYNGCVYAVVNNKIFYSPDGNKGNYTDISIQGITSSNLSRIELSIAPTDPDYIYASVINKDGSQKGIYRSTNKGANWDLIGPAASNKFNIFGFQGRSNNTIKVFPNNKNKVLVGGINLWIWEEGETWQQNSLSNIDQNSPIYLHSAHHDIIFHPTNPQIFYHISDGGISKSTDGGLFFTKQNRKLATTQFFNINCNMFDVVVGGTQNNGSVYINSNLTTSEGFQFMPDIGASTAMSYINPAVVVGSFPYGNVQRSFENGANTKNFYNSKHMTIPTKYSYEYATYIAPILLDEQINDEKSRDSIWYFAPTYLKKDTVVIVKSKRNNNFPFLYKVGQNMEKGDSVLIQDKVQSRFYVGMTGSVYMTKGLHNFSRNPDWYKIAKINGSAQSIAGTSDGDIIFVGTTTGKLYRIANLTTVNDSISGNLWINETTINPYCNIEVKEISSASNAITSISVDTKNPEKVLYTVGNYNATNRVFYSTNALDSMPTFANKTGNLPKMPVYASVIEMQNSSKVFVGTELGVFYTDNITTSSPIWIEDNSIIGRTPTYTLIQQYKNYPYTKNYGIIYAGTHGRGIFKNSAYVGIDDEFVQTENKKISIFPNPANDNVYLGFNSSNVEKATLSIYSIDGKLVLNKIVSLQNGHNELNIDVSTLNIGSYVVEIISETQKLTSKLVKR